ncbi:uncharacterized protein METZ01_LOCUS470528, partial [marine metagenome]
MVWYAINVSWIPTSGMEPKILIFFDVVRQGIIL